jgi:hypothetical protein
MRDGARRSIWYIHLGVLCLVCSANANADPPANIPTEDQQLRAYKLLDDAWKAIGEPRSGKVTVRETIKRMAVEEKIDDMEHFWAFDVASGSERWDTIHTDKVERTTRFAKNPKESLLYQQSGLLVRLPREEKPRVHDAKPFDFRWIGLSGIGTMRARRPHDQPREFQLKHCKTSLVDFRDDSDISRAVWEFQANAKLDCRFVFEVDRRAGMRPVLAEEHYRNIADDGSRGEWYLEWRTKTRWERVGETWIPATARMEAATIDQVAELTFDWKNVNREIAPETFEMAGLQAVRILTAKNGPPNRE